MTCLVLFQLMLSLSGPAAQDVGPVAQPPVFKAGATAVVLDVVIRDRRGRPVRDIQPGELTVLEDGVSRQIKSFRLIERAGAVADPVQSSARAGTAPDALQSPILVTLVFDHLSQNARALARRAALQFVSGAMAPNQWVSVYALEQRLRLAQPFTRDADALRAAIVRATAAAGEGRDRLAGQSDREAADRAAGAATGAVVTERPTVDTAAIGAAVTEARVSEIIARMARMVETADIQQRGQSTLFPLMALMKAQGALAGRKALLLFSEGMPIPPNLEEPYRAAISEANRANVSIYAVDARGLDTGRSLEQSRQMLDRSGRNSQSQIVSGSSQRPVTLDDVMNSEVAEGALRADTQNALRALAEETSGTLIGNSNDLGPDLVERVRADLDSYYEIGYTPSAAPPDGRFRPVEVKVGRRGVSVHSRSGYFALPETEAAPLMPYELPMLAAAATDPPPQAFQYAARAFRFDQTPGAVKHTLIVEVPLEHLTFREDRRARSYSMRFTTMAIVKDRNGDIVQRFSESYPLEGPIDRLPALKRGRLRFKRQFSLRPGHYVLTIVARDQATERSSVRSFPLDVTGPIQGVRVSDVAIIRSVEQAGEAADSVEDPFRTETMRIAPNLDLPISKATNSQISAYLTVYPADTTSLPGLVFEFLHNGTVVGRSAAELPSPDDSGRIKYVASFPTAMFGPGTYELRAVATQGTTSAVAQTHFTLVP